MTHKIILDTDPGIDDAMAILFAEAHPAIELLAITPFLATPPSPMAPATPSGSSRSTA